MPSVRLLLPFALLFVACGADSRNDQSGDSIVLPELTGRVVDGADLLAPQMEADLTRKLGALQSRTGDQFVVVTLESLGSAPIEEWGMRLGNGWGIGQPDKDNGALLIVAPNERKVRIEVGLGLETVLTNESADQIIQTIILPHFRADRMAAGIIAGVDACISVLDDGIVAQPMKEAA
ncbi:MAG: TPM domain-containing protein [Pseudomonadota bacterium]|nr:TPM domain-containing protein [Pseudomonadota bacterium]